MVDEPLGAAAVALPAQHGEPGEPSGVADGGLGDSESAGKLGLGERGGLSEGG